MLERFWERKRNEEGFTLIELMVVVLIIGILIAIALPTFLGARNRANDRAAQSNLRNGIAAAKVYFTDNDTYAGATDVLLEAIEPSLNFVLAAPAIDQVELTGVTATTVVLNALSGSGTVFCLADNSTTAPGTVRGVGTAATWALCNGLVDW